jgi:hypothetical protein
MAHNWWLPRRPARTPGVGPSAAAAGLRACGAWPCTDLALRSLAALRHFAAYDCQGTTRPSQTPTVSDRVLALPLLPRLSAAKVQKGACASGATYPWLRPPTVLASGARSSSPALGRTASRPDNLERANPAHGAAPGCLRRRATFGLGSTDDARSLRRGGLTGDVKAIPSTRPTRGRFAGVSPSLPPTKSWGDDGLRVEASEDLSRAVGGRGVGISSAGDR